jgi:hypothetical protein
MGAFAPIKVGDLSVNDAAYSATGATAGVRTFVPSFIDSAGVATYYIMDTGEVLDAREKFTLSVRQPTKGSQVARITAKLVVPVMDADDSTLKIGEAIATAEFVIPKRMLDTERQKVWAMFANLIQGSGTSDATAVQGDQSSVVYSGVVDLAGVY